MANRFSRFSGALVYLFFLLAAGGCLSGLEPQNPSEIFADRQTLTPDLEELANPKPAKPSWIKMLARKDPSGRVNVAVVDNGADYLHPALVRQIAFDWRDGQIVGAGVDVMGQDSWAHPTLLSPVLHAFVAEAVEGPRLKGVNSDPSQLVMRIQDDFLQQLLPLVKSDPVLAQSVLGQKLTEHALDIYSAWDIIREHKKELLKAHAQAKKEGLMLTENSMSRPELFEKVSYSNMEEIFKKPWVADSYSGYSSGLYMALSYTEQGPLFLEKLELAVNAVQEKYQLSERIMRVARYLKALSSDASAAIDAEGALERLNQAWFNLHFQYASSTSVLAFAKAFCKNLPEQVRNQLAQTDLPDTERFKIVRREYLNQIRHLANFYHLVQTEPSVSPSADKARLKGVEDSLKGIQGLPRLFDATFSNGPKWLRFLTCSSDMDLWILKDSGLIKYAKERYHPSLNSQSSDTSHGTHVSGIIARQSKKIDIVPVRVVTSSMAYVDDVADRIRADFETQFAIWAKRPEVRTATGLIVPKVFGAGAPAITPEKLTEMLKSHLDAEFKPQYLDFYFFYQMLQAIQVVGQKKVKIANMSLGTSFEKDVLVPGDMGLDQRVKNFMNYMTYEFFKFRVAEAIEKYAKKTLFVIAAGNDGKWLDGKSRSGLPCDLSSPLLKQAQQGAPIEAVVPNNRIDNIVCVGSIDYNDDLSAFSNLPLTEVPFVVSYGESIYSTVKTTDCSGAEESVQEKIGKPGTYYYPTLDYKSDRYDAFYRRAGWMEPRPDDQGTDPEKLPRTLRQRAYYRFQSDLDLLSSSLRGTLKERLCQESKHPFARMSGTSMATPAVAGFIAASLVPEINRRGLTPEQVYDLPEFSPPTLIRMMQEKSPVFGGDNVLKDVSKVIGVKNWKKLTAAKGQSPKIIGAINPSEFLGGK